MTDRTSPQDALAHLAAALQKLGCAFALVGGLGVSVRAELRFTRDVDVALAVDSDEEAERVIFALALEGYRVVATVEHEARRRLATARLVGPSGIVVDLLVASSGIEREIVQRAAPVEVRPAGQIMVATPEDLLTMKVLSMTPRRLQDRLDARNLLLFNPELDIEAVRTNLALISDRGYNRSQELGTKLDELLLEVDEETREP